MAQKPYKYNIEYVQSFYSYGSEAKVIQFQPVDQEEKPQLPKQEKTPVTTICMDPIAFCGIMVAVVMLVVMILGAVQLHDDWNAYQQMDDYVTTLRAKNAELTLNYRSLYDLEDIEMKALAMGMVPADQVETRSVTVSVPEVRETVLTWDQKVVRAWNELWA